MNAANDDFEGPLPVRDAPAEPDAPAKKRKG